MITSTRKQIVTTNLAVAAFFLSLSFYYLPSCGGNNNNLIYGARAFSPMGNQSATTVNQKDTTKKKQYVYYFKIREESFREMQDSISNRILPTIGYQLSAPDADRLRYLAQYKIYSILGKGMILDSIEIIQPKK